MSTIVEAPLKSVKKSFEYYTFGLLKCLVKKTCTGMAVSLSVTHDSVYRFLNSKISFEEVFTSMMIRVIDYYSRGNSGFLIIDDTAIPKIFSRVMTGGGLVYDSCLGRPNKGYAIVVLVWSNGKIVLPIAFQFWFSKDVVDEKDRRKKSEISQDLLIKYGKKVLHNFVLLDGLYCSANMINFLNEKLFKFEMRIARNRIVTINGKTCRIDTHPELRLSRNSRSKIVKGHWQGIELYFTADKRINKNNEYEIVFQISNMNISSEEHVDNYKRRWGIEKFFRISKQKLGLGDCQSRDIEKQRGHIYAVFYVFALIQIIKIDNNLDCSEDVIKQLRNAKPNTLTQSIQALNQLFAYVT